MNSNVVFVLLLSIVALLLTNVSAQPTGWRMIDRFYGFRYELVGDVIGKGIEEFSQQKANELGCFGWIQKTSRGTLVGEGRCSKKQGPAFEELLRGKAESMTVLVYTDTKIRLHFSHFKILDPSRDTCFYDEPHRCEDIVDDSMNSQQPNRRGEEL